MAKTYNCPFCQGKKFDRHKLPIHISKYHEDDLPEGLTAYRFAYDIINNHPNHKGACVVCGSDCEWNEKRQKYERLCGKKSCKEAIQKTYQERMMRVYNKPHLMDDVNHLEKMLAHRKISGKYKWSDGKVFTYTGSYEKNFLEFLDKVMDYRSDEIISPGPVLEYDYKGKKHKWITDVMILPYNLIVEIKDGGDNKNGNTAWKGTRAKTIAKEVMITNLGKYNYIRLTNNDFAQFLGIIAELKMQIVDDTVSPLYRIHEDTSLDEGFFLTNIFKDTILGMIKEATQGINARTGDKLDSAERAGAILNLLALPIFVTAGIPFSLVVDLFITIIGKFIESCPGLKEKLIWLRDYESKQPEPKQLTKKQLSQLKTMIKKSEEYLNREKEDLQQEYISLKTGKPRYGKGYRGSRVQISTNEQWFREILKFPNRYPGVTEQSVIKLLHAQNCDYKEMVEQYLDTDEPKVKKAYEFFKDKKCVVIEDDCNGWVFCKDNNKFYKWYHDEQEILLDKSYTFKDVVNWYKNVDCGYNPDEDYSYIDRLENDLEELKNKYEKYSKQPLNEEYLPEAIDNPYMLREAQEWEHLTHMWGNAIDDIIGNVTNSPFEVAKGSYIDHDPETGKEVCVMRTIRPKAELKNREYRDRLKKQMYHLQQKINKAYNVHPSVMFIQYPIDNTNLTEGLIIGITKTSR